MFEGVLLFGTAILYDVDYELHLIDEDWTFFFGAYLGSMACGLQNGLCTNLTGAVIRTVHVTGLLTVARAATILCFAFLFCFSPPTLPGPDGARLVYT